MIVKPIFNPVYNIVTIENEGIYLLSEKEEVVLQGEIYKLLAPLIDGHRTPDELVDLLVNRAKPTDIYYALMAMEKKGYITEVNDLQPGINAFWNTLEVDAPAAVEKIKTTKVSVHQFGDMELAEIYSKLKLSGFQVGSDSDFDIVLTDDYLREELAAFNKKALQTNRSWILAKPIGTTLWVGPVFRPGLTGCWECLAHRLRIHRSTQAYLQHKKNTTQPFITSRGGLPSTLDLALNLIVTEVCKAIVLENDHILDSCVMTFDLLNLQTQTHKLVRRPQCFKCGGEAKENQESKPIVLKSYNKQLAFESGHRQSTNEETLDKYEHLVSPITGIINSLNRTSNDGLLHVYTAGQNLSMRQEVDRNLSDLRDHLRSKSGGKGINDMQAKVGALCEAVERYSGLFQGDEPRIQASYQELGNKALHPNTCMNFSEKQYQNREDWNKGKKWNHRIPEPFNEESTISWTPVWSLTEQRFKYLPTAYCYYRYTDSPHHIFCVANSNGAAAGNTLEEAIFQGFMEVVERDAVAVWWYNHIQRPMVDISSFEIPYLRNLEDYYKSLNREFWVLDITHDFKIPTFAAISRRIGHREEEITFGFGTHFDPKVALTRAVTELNQFQVAVLAKERIKNFDAETLNWWATATLKNQRQLEPDESIPVRTIDDYSYIWSNDIREDILRCQSLVEDKGMEMLVLDQTRSDIGLPVVKVIVPGMRHFWGSFAQGRLFDVPVKMGWLQEPFKEEELNSTLIFI